MSTIVLIILAVLPALYLIRKIYNMDKIEKEPLSLLIELFCLGAVIVFVAARVEAIGIGILQSILNENSLLYILIENILIVGLAEEGLKYICLKKSFDHPAFDYRFDGIVYAASVSIGFAALENIFYGLEFGTSVLFMRAFLSIPAHTINSIFMGHYFSEAKQCAILGDHAGEKEFKKKAVLIPMLLHGLYDAFASISFIQLLMFVIIVDTIAIKKIKKYGREDAPFCFLKPTYYERDTDTYGAI